MKKTLVIFAFALNAGLTVFGFVALISSPYTGIRMGVCGEQACVKRVDRDSPAHGNVEAGDTLLGINARNVPYFAFSPDPDYISSRSDQRVFWQMQRVLETLVAKGRPVVVTFSRNGRPVEITLSPVPFPVARAIAATTLQYFVGWTFVIVAYLVLRKKQNHLSAANFIIGTFAGSAFITLAPYCARDVAFPFDSFRLLSVTNYLATQIFCYALLHIMLVFPREKAVLRRYPRAVAVPYILFIFVSAAHFAELFENTHLTTYMSMNACMFTTLGVFVFDFLRERNPVYRKQIQWVVIGSLAGISSWLVLTSLPIVFGVSYLDQEISILPTVIYPLSFAFAVTRYRLMEIESILDAAVVYGFTILILAGVETAFLSFASPYLLTAGTGLPAFSVIAVLLIVFIYVPIRNFVKGIVERLFKRGKYDPEKELQRFTVSLGLCDERSALEKFTAFVRSLFRPSGVFILKTGEGTASVLYADAEEVQGHGSAVLARAAAAWEYIRKRGTCILGYELSEALETGGTPVTPDLESALFVPFITDPADTTSGYLAILLKKWNETAYSVKDVTLLNAISVNIANIIEAGELRKERDAIEERFRKEKDAVMKELHDGLGNILTSVTVASQAAEKMLARDDRKARDLVARIENFSAEAMDFLRTGLTVLDNPRGDIGSLLAAVKERYGDLLESSGMQLELACSADAARLRPGAMIVMHLTRVIQEALTNSIKHSGAKRVRIEAVRTKERIAVTVTDDGKGFDDTAKKAGHGILNIRRRTAEMHGAVEITTSPESGTRIGLRIPLAGCGGTQEGMDAAGDR